MECEGVLHSLFCVGITSYISFLGMSVACIMTTAIRVVVMVPQPSPLRCPLSPQWFCCTDVLTADLCCVQRRPMWLSVITLHCFVLLWWLCWDLFVWTVLGITSFECFPRGPHQWAQRNRHGSAFYKIRFFELRVGLCSCQTIKTIGGSWY